jgi:hypothetical protein
MRSSRWLGLVVDYVEHGRSFPNRRANAGPEQNYFGLKSSAEEVRRHYG